MVIYSIIRSIGNVISIPGNPILPKNQRSQFILHNFLVDVYHLEHGLETIFLEIFSLNIPFKYPPKRGFTMRVL
jgi:hypothetical protein